MGGNWSDRDHVGHRVMKPRVRPSVQPPMIDPTAGLALLIASAPGAYALFLGSGVSSPLIPTGAEIRRATLERIYTAQQGGPPPSSLDLDAWWLKQGGSSATYSELLARAFPTAEERRTFLERFFV